MTKRMPRKERAMVLCERLAEHYPETKIALNYKTPLQLLVATILSAQCTDERVNQTTPALFKKYKTAKAYAEADSEELQEIIRSTGFFKQKAKSIQNCCVALIEKHGGKLPDTMEDLVKLPGVGRKTANVILGKAFDQPAVVVDTHVKRLAGRLDLSRNTDPDKIEMDLRKLLPAEEWTGFSNRLIFHGRQVCNARKPKCDACFAADICPSYSKFNQ